MVTVLFKELFLIKRAHGEFPFNWVFTDKKTCIPYMELKIICTTKLYLRKTFFFKWKFIFIFLWKTIANLEELQSVESRQAANLETQLEELKERCQEKQNTVEEIRYSFLIEDCLWITKNLYRGKPFLVIWWKACTNNSLYRQQLYYILLFY